MTIRATRVSTAALAFAALPLACGSSKTKVTGSADASVGPTDGAAYDGAVDSSTADGSTIPAPDGSPSTADAASPCPPYESLCKGVCIPTVIDPANCGGCGVTCPSPEVCSGGACESSCLPGLTACSQSCVDETTDNANCGKCGNLCPPMQGCSNGTCVPETPLDDAGALCIAGGAPISVGPDGGGQCVGLVAATTFTWALCSCTDITFSASVLTDGWNSATGPYVPGGLGGGVGLNGNFAASVPTIEIGGTLWEASDGGMTQEAQTEVRQELHVGGPLFGAALTVRGDVHVTGDVSGGPGDAATPGVPYFNIDGGLYISPDASITGKVTYAGPRMPELTPVTAPCDCTSPIPVAAIAQSGVTTNDNSLIGLDAGLLSSFNTPGRVDLPCGTYYFDSISPTGPLTIVAHGHTVILVGGDLMTTSPVEITVDSTGSLDVFIAGTISDSAHLAFGNPNYPALERLYVGTALGIPFTSDVELAANLYAAASNLVSWSSTNVIYGSVIAGNFISSQPTVIHYDQGVLGSGAACTDGGTSTCETCTDCGNQACVGGTCGACSTSAECCAPLECIDGTCVIVPPP